MPVLVRPGPLGRRIRWRDKLRDHVGSRPPGRIVKGRHVLLHGPAGALRIAILVPVLPRERALLVGIGLDQARIDQRLCFTGQLFSQYRR
jgi:hypothetical protein